MSFEEYLISKKIDSEAFKVSEASLWETWRYEFEQMHPNSFTIQKLNLINPVRRKYPAKQIAEVKPVVEQKVESEKKDTDTVVKTEATPLSSSPPKPAVARPVFKPKPKIN